MTSTKIYLVPMGEIEPEMLEIVGEALFGNFGVESVITPRIPISSNTFCADRGQYRSDRILNDQLFWLHRPHAARVLGIIDDDCFVSELPFVVGQSRPRGREALVAFGRLREEFHYRIPSFGRLVERVVKESVHQLGHTFGLDAHCEEVSCVMFYSRTISQMDEKSFELCDRCQVGATLAEEFATLGNS